MADRALPEADRNGGLDALKVELGRRDWTPATDRHGWVWVKGRWKVVFDTSSWLEIYSGSYRVYEVPVLQERHADWTLQLIGHLLTLHDEAIGAT